MFDTNFDGLVGLQ